jgi:exosortase N
VLSKVKISKGEILPILFVLGGSLPLMWLSLQYFDGIQWFGFLILPFILKIDRWEMGGRRFLWLALVFALLFLSLGQNYWGFAAGLSLIYHFLNTRIGKLNSVAVYTIIFYLPLTKSFFTLFGFHIRMFITEWAGVVLSFFNNSVTFSGSRIWVDGSEFTVDAGCMGLRLVITGFLLTLLIIQQVFKRKGIKPRAIHLSMFLSASFLLVIVVNFIRILLVIQLQSVAGSWSHELIGLSIFLFFHVIPMYLLVSQVHPSKHSNTELPNRIDNKGFLDVWLASVLVCLMLAKSVYAPQKARLFEAELSMTEIPGFEFESNMDGVKRYTKGEVILLVKPMFPLSFSNHHPMLCWRGDGFSVTGESIGMIGEVECFQASLHRSDSQLKTTWWYVDEKGERTTSELDWRIRALMQQEQFYLVNFVSPQESQMLFTMNATKNGQLAFGSVD